MSEIYLSVIIPAYNEENRLPATLQQITDFLASQDYTAEVLVIENGSNDRTLEVAQGFAEAHPGFKAISHPERGKGLAVQKGMLAAQGEHRLHVRCGFIHAHPRNKPISTPGTWKSRCGDRLPRGSWLGAL